ncbi:unnamed protein product, partial [Ixodes persulcatus]
VIRELLEDAGTFYATTTRMGLCMPSSCSRQDVESIVKGGSAIQWLSSLSAYETARKILVVRAPKDDDSRHLQAFHGLRALSIVWVVWVHHYAYNDISVYSGAKMAKKLVVQYNTQLFNNGWLAVDTFFFVRRTYLSLFLMGLMVIVGVAVVMGQTLFNDYQPTALFVAVCWAVSLCSSATILFCTKEWGSGDVPSPWVSAAYAGTHRLGWGLCLAWVVVACVSGIVNTILSSRLLVPISRLSYSIYVLHVPLVWLRMWTIRERILISFMPMFYNGMGTFILSLVVAFLGTLFFERSLTAVKDVALGFFSSLGRDEKAKPSSEKKTTFNIVFQTHSPSDPIFSGESVAKVDEVDKEDLALSSSPSRCFLPLRVRVSQSHTMGFSKKMDATNPRMVANTKLEMADMN